MGVALAALLPVQGVEVPVDSLRCVPYAVEFSERLSTLLTTRLGWRQRPVGSLARASREDHACRQPRSGSCR